MLQIMVHADRLALDPSACISHKSFGICEKRRLRLRSQGEKKPKEAIGPLCGDSVHVELARNVELTFKQPIIDLHRKNSDRFGGPLNRLQAPFRFRSAPLAPNSQLPRLDFDFNLIVIDTGHLKTNSKTGGTLKDIGSRAPSHIRLPEVRKMNFGELVGHLTDLALQSAQANRSNL